MERRARGRCAAVRPCCRRLATGRASHAGWHTLCRRSCCRAAEGGRERRTRRGRSSAALGRPKRASAGRPRRACRPRRRLLGAGSGASGPRTKHIQVKVKVRGVCAACSAALRGSGEGWASAFLNRAGDRSFLGHLRPSSAFCPPHLLRLGHASARCVCRLWPERSTSRSPKRPSSPTLTVQGLPTITRSEKDDR